MHRLIIITIFVSIGLVTSTELIAAARLIESDMGDELYEKLNNNRSHRSPSFTTLIEIDESSEVPLISAVIQKKKVQCLDACIRYYPSVTEDLEKEAFSMAFKEAIKDNWVDGIRKFLPLLPPAEGVLRLALENEDPEFKKVMGQYGLDLLLKHIDSSFIQEWMKETNPTDETLKEWRLLGLNHVREGLGSILTFADPSHFDFVPHTTILRTLYTLSSEEPLWPLLQNDLLWQKVPWGLEDTKSEAEKSVSIIRHLCVWVGVEEATYFRTPIDGILPLHFAIKKEKSYIVKEVLDQRLSSYEDTDPRGNNALHHSVTWQKVPILNDLLHRAAVDGKIISFIEALNLGDTSSVYNGTQKVDQKKRKMR